MSIINNVYTYNCRYTNILAESIITIYRGNKNEVSLIVTFDLLLNILLLHIILFQAKQKDYLSL